jgi:hypothetical protein
MTLRPAERRHRVSTSRTPLESGEHCITEQHLNPFSVTLEHLSRCLCAVRLQYPVAGIAKDLASYIADKALVFNDKNGRACLAALIHLGASCKA